MEKLCVTEVSNDNVMRMSPEVFTGLGTFGEQYEIKLKKMPFHMLYMPLEIYLSFYSRRFRKNYLECKSWG